MKKKVDNPDIDYGELERLVDQAASAPEPEERLATWTCVRPFPDLAKQLAAKRGDVAKAEIGYETRTGKRHEGWLLSILRPIGENLYHYTKFYKKRDWKGVTTARTFMEEAYTYFKEEEINYVKKLH